MEPWRGGDDLVRGRVGGRAPFTTLVTEDVRKHSGKTCASVRVVSGFRCVVALARAEAEIWPPWRAHSDSPEMAVCALGGRVVAEQVLRSQIGSDLAER